MKKAVEVKDLDDRSEAIGRNGKFGIRKLSILPGRDDDASRGLIKIACTSKTLNRDLNAGIIIGVEDMDRLAKEWLRTRGEDPSTPGGGKLADGRTIAQAASEIQGLAEGIQKAVE
jgi:hypothetical protein